MTPRQVAEKLYQSLNCHMVTPQIVELDVKLIEVALIEARNAALEEAEHVAKKLSSEHKIEVNLREAFCARIRALKHTREGEK